MATPTTRSVDIGRSEIHRDPESRNPKSEARRHRPDALDRIDDAVLPPDKKKLIHDVLQWYKTNHPLWFKWLDLR